MPLDRLVLILVIVLGGAAGTIWLAAMIVSTLNVSPLMTLALVSPLGLLAYVFWRVLQDRLQREERDYDDIDY